jgi:26S proteasome regulatory subunit N12
MLTPAVPSLSAQLKVYYTDCASLLPESPRQYPLLGLNLLRLLAQNRIAEFHTELELLPPGLQASNEYLKFPAQLEQHIMEGSYNRVLSAKQTGTYAAEGLYFMDMLVDMVRDEIAECSEKAYKSIAVADLQSMLMLGSEAELSDFATNRGWRIDGTNVTFGTDGDKPLALPASQLIHESLAYAKELERIV